MQTYEEDYVEVYGEFGSMTGYATYEYKTSYGLNSDVGGVDGEDIDYITLFSFVIDGLCLSRDQVALVCGIAGVDDMENRVAEKILEGLSQ